MFTKTYPEGPYALSWEEALKIENSDVVKKVRAGGVHFSIDHRKYKSGCLDSYTRYRCDVGGWFIHTWSEWEDFQAGFQMADIIREID